MQMQTKEKTEEFLKIAIPAVLESLVSVIIATIDTKMIAVLGKQAISAVSFTTQPKLIFFSIFFALGTTTSIFVAQANGKNDPKEGNYFFHTILKITILMSVILGIMLWFLAEPIMKLCNRQSDTLQMSVSFFKIVGCLMIFQAVSVVLNAALRGIGKTKVTLISNIATGLVDIIFNYLLIEGHLGFPRLEVRGDAIATVLGTAAACLVSVIAILLYSDFLSFRGLFRERMLANYEGLKSIGSKAVNIIFENIFTRIGFLLSSIVLSMLPSDETAVYSVTMILLNYSFAFGDGIQSTVVALTGRSYGSNDPKGFRQYTKIANIAGISCAGVLSVIYITMAQTFYGAFFSDHVSIMNGVRSSWIASGLTVVQIVRIVQVGVMRGMGEVKDPRRIATICVLILNPLCSYLLAFPAKCGVWGIWQGAVISQVCWLILCLILCQKHMMHLEEKGAT